MISILWKEKNINHRIQWKYLWIIHLTKALLPGYIKKFSKHTNKNSKYKQNEISTVNFIKKHMAQEKLLNTINFTNILIKTITDQISCSEKIERIYFSEYSWNPWTLYTRQHKIQTGNEKADRTWPSRPQERHNREGPRISLYLTYLWLEPERIATHRHQCGQTKVSKMFLFVCLSLQSEKWEKAC